MKIQNPATVFFFGKSGCGKGTQATLLQKLLEQDGQTVLSVETGKEFRTFAQTDNYSAHLTHDIMMRGDFMPAFMPVWIWAQRLIHDFTGTEALILDGLARKIAEAPVLDSALKFYGRHNIYVIYIDVSREWSKKRLLERGRADDTPEKIDHRLAAFEAEVPLVLEYFRERKGYAYIQVNGEQSVEQVHAEILDGIENCSFVC